MESQNIYHNKTAQWLSYLVVFVGLAFLPTFIDPFTLNQFSRYAVLAMLAVSVSLVWGFGGILSLGQGIAFGLAAYGMGMTMQMQFQDPESNPIPSFMLTNELSELPGLWVPFWNTEVGLLLALAVPTVFFVIFGALMFQARVAGAFVAIMTLAMLAAWYSMAYDMQPFTAGFNGISPPLPFDWLGVSFDPYSPITYWVALGLLAFVVLASKLVLQSKFGLIIQAIRDDAERVRFVGYNVAFYQVVIFAMSGFIAAIAGITWVMLTQYVSPVLLEVQFSIAMVIWAAVGGRLSLMGAMIGAFLVNGMQSYVGDAFQSTWLLIIGGLFILVVRFLPKGIAGLIETGLGYVPIGRRRSDSMSSNPARAAE
ncbi:MAG: urea ABC transporter permease subunit UrtC [Rhodospirillaceae bacterium]|nr:urea ABC transporter permease subunit UrtC [Rhodospirillaceae bacterium]